jgi:CubicO group peptidase (beta-lactamase class C family)
MRHLQAIMMLARMLKIVLLALLVTSCEMYDSAGQYSCQCPDSLGDGFDMGTMDEVNINTRLIEEAVNKIQGSRYPEVHSMLIYRDGKLVLDEYFQGHQYKWDAPYHHGEWVTWDPGMLHDLMSSSKSITSCLTGIAIQEGFIESVHQSIFDYLPEHQQFRKSGWKRAPQHMALTKGSIFPRSLPESWVMVTTGGQKSIRYTEQWYMCIRPPVSEDSTSWYCPR